MSLNDTPKAKRIHIGFFGKRNAGKSSLVNAFTASDISIVSEEKGTTTDPVIKSMEILPLGPVVIIDTPGFDDIGDLGQKRVERAKDTLNKCDIAILVTDITPGLTKSDRLFLSSVKEKHIPYLIVYNKCDLTDSPLKSEGAEISVSAKYDININQLRDRVAHLLEKKEEKYIVRDLIKKGDLIVLVIPIDESAPKGRIILPQQLVLREILDSQGKVLCLQVGELSDALKDLKNPPSLVITDSQAFKEVAKILPEEIPLTSFSILMARYNGFLDTGLQGLSAIDSLQDEDRILISEGCTHHRQCKDIGTVKIPMLLKKHTEKNLVIETSSGETFPKDLSPYALIIHCGGCMLNEKEMHFRKETALSQGIPFTNYGLALAFFSGILERAVNPLMVLLDKGKEAIKSTKI